jgi:aspartate/methionine/tyrosine aminotransferase
MLRSADLEAIAEIRRPHRQIWIYADEIYSRFAYDGEFESIASLPGMQERTIISDGASKTWAMTGWRIGYIANRTLAPVFTRWITNTDSCASQISQWAAVEAIEGPQEAAAAMRASFLERRDLIVELLNAVPGITCKTPGGAFYAWPNVTEACRMTGCALSWRNTIDSRSRPVETERLYFEDPYGHLLEISEARWAQLNQGPKLSDRLSMREELAWRTGEYRRRV